MGAENVIARLDAAAVRCVPHHIPASATLSLVLVMDAN
jgi:hypothetical protein